MLSSIFDQLKSVVGYSGAAIYSVWGGRLTLLCLEPDLLDKDKKEFIHLGKGIERRLQQKTKREAIVPSRKYESRIAHQAKLDVTCTYRKNQAIYDLLKGEIVLRMVCTSYNDER